MVSELQRVTRFIFALVKTGLGNMGWDEALENVPDNLSKYHFIIR